MFRLFFALMLIFVLRSFASTQNESTNKVSSTNGTQQNQCGKTPSNGCCNCRDGRDGRDGQNGLQGKDGRDGRDGRNGAKGLKGEPGTSAKPPHGAIPGEKGMKGDKGEEGFRGNDGINGINGTKGQKGEAISGKDGRDGNKGSTGIKGGKGEQGFRGNDGINGRKGLKGAPGSPAKPPHGAIKFSDTAEKCTLSTAGTVRYSTSQNALQLCDGSAWLVVLTPWKGHVANKPGRHCLDILNTGQSRGNGLYWIDPNGGSTDDSFQAFCDMETELGGWTLVATKVSPSFDFIKTGFSTLAAKTKDADSASHIHPGMGDWEELMFRFGDVNTIRVIYSRKAGAPQNDKTEFDKFLMGKSLNLLKNVFGFYKYSPADHNKRSPAVGFATISSFHFYSRSGITEHHYNGGTDKWLDMWDSADGSNNYVTSDDSKARGTKCIAGYCYLNKPIWVMVR